MSSILGRCNSKETANPPKSDDKYRISLTNVWGYLNNVPFYVISFLKKGVLYKEIWYAQKSVQLVRDSFFRSDFLQNPYFKIFGQKWDQEVESIYARGVCLNYEQKPCD